MSDKPFSRLTRNDVFCAVVSNVNAAIGEIDIGNVHKARAMLAEAIRLASLHPTHGGIANLHQLDREPRAEG